MTDNKTTLTGSATLSGPALVFMTHLDMSITYHGQGMEALTQHKNKTCLHGTIKEGLIFNHTVLDLNDTTREEAVHTIICRGEI